MLTKRDLEAMLRTHGRAFAAHPRDERSLLVAGAEPQQEPLTIAIDDAIVTLRLRVGPAAKATPEVLRRLLVLNAQALVNSSFGIRGDDLVLEASLGLSHLEPLDVAATLDEMDLMRAEAFD